MPVPKPLPNNYKNRPDTGTQRNTIIWLAAGIVSFKVEELQCIADQFKEKGDLERYEKLSKQAEEMRQVVKVLDEHAGCWS